MGFIGKIWSLLRQPSGMALGTLLIGGFVAGVIFFASFHFIMSATNSMDLCISCHEMEGVYEEYKESIHYKNASGVRATCSDCHVPKDKDFSGWLEKLKFKIVVGGKDIWHHTIGTYDTKEKFEAARWEMANRIWDDMRARDSKECRNCHNYDAMDMTEQDKLAAKKHATVMEKGDKTCIDCHTAVAHDEPEEPDGDNDGKEKEEK